MPPEETNTQAPVPAGDPNQFPIDPNKRYVVILQGVAIAAVRSSLDIVGRNAGADQGRPFWDLRGAIGNQVIQADQTEAEASGLIAGREAQRAAAKAGELKKDAAEVVAKAVGSRRKK